MGFYLILMQYKLAQVNQPGKSLKTIVADSQGWRWYCKLDIFQQKGFNNKNERKILKISSENKFYGRSFLMRHVPSKMFLR